MTRLRAALKEIAADVPEYGDLDHAIAQAEVARRRRLRVRGGIAAAALVVATAGTLLVTRAPGNGPGSLTGSTTPSAVPLLVEGPLSPGRYRYVLTSSCEDSPHGCPPGVQPPPPLDIDLTVPAGWEQLPDFPNVITPATAALTGSPDGAALVLGWTGFLVHLYSNPCRSDSDGPPDVAVGPGVDDFVDAVQAQQALDVSPASTARVGGHRARFFTLRAPADISGCAQWRPWDPGFYAQGPGNIWDVWVVDVDGSRVLIVANYYPGTSAKVRAELRQMVESIGFGR